MAEAPVITAPMLMHLAEEDEFISSAAQADIKAALAEKPNVEILSYPGYHHAFSRHGGAHYNAQAAAKANAASPWFIRSRDFPTVSRRVVHEDHCNAVVVGVFLR